MQLPDLDATACAELVKSGAASPAELVDAAIKRIERSNPELGAVTIPLFEEARAANPAPGPFRGVPILIKDLNQHVAGTLHTEGLLPLKRAGHRTPTDSHLVAALRRAGFVIVGKTNTSELGIVPTTESLAWNATAGATGGGLTLVNVGRAGGAPIPTFAPLVGGCRGGNFSGTLPRVGGAGGGAVQLVANSRVELSGGGIIDVGGGGGDSFAGGGSGGNIVIEAPTMIFDGSSTGIFANGGAGGGCSLSGEDATRTAFRALAPKCSPSSAGDGGTESSPPQPGQTKCTSGTCSLINEHQGGGGGGSTGRLLIGTGTGVFSANGSPTLSVAVSKTTLVVN